MLKSILFTHTDLDGAGCRVVYEIAHNRLVKGVDFDVVHCDNWNIDDIVSNRIGEEDIDLKTHIVFADICSSIECLKKLKDKGYRVDILDHHRTNFPACQVFENAIIVPENALGIMESGTSLLYKFYSEKDELLKGFHFGGVNTELLALFVDTVRSYDTWEWKSTDNVLAKRLQMLFSLLSMERFCKRYIGKIMDTGIKELIMESDMDFVNAKLEYEEKVINEFTEDDVFQLELRGYKIALVLSTKFINFSSLADAFLKKNPQYDLMINFSVMNNGGFSFRTIRDDIDLGAVFAAPIGGGGHPQAAGAGMSDEAKDRLLDLIIDSLNGKF